jgi:hypothetical protein
VLVEREDLPEAFAAVGAARPPHRRPRSVTLPPHAIGLLLVARAAGDPELRIAFELLQQPREVVRLDRDVGVELDDDGRERLERCEAGVEAADDRRPAGERAAGRAGEADPWVRVR